MPTAQVVDICRHTLLEVLLLAAPILAIAVVVSLTGQHRSSADIAAGGHDFGGTKVAGGGGGFVLLYAVDVAADRSVHGEIAFRFSSVREITMEISLD